MTCELLAIRGGEFTGSAVRDGANISAYLKGNGDTTAAEAVSKLLAGLHDEATRARTQEVVVDLRELEFLNSTCLKSFVTWISNVQHLEAAQQYRIRFVANADMHWQKRSLNALRCFAVNLIEIDGLSPPS